MSELQIPRHRGHRILVEPHSKSRFLRHAAKSMFDLTGKKTFVMVKNELPDPGPRKSLSQVAINVTKSMTPPQNNSFSTIATLIDSRDRRLK